jgi:hypothetical protein
MNTLSIDVYIFISKAISLPISTRTRYYIEIQYFRCSILNEMFSFDKVKIISGKQFDSIEKLFSKFLFINKSNGQQF